MNAILREAHNERLRRSQHQVHHSQEQEAVAVVRFLSDVPLSFYKAQRYAEANRTLRTTRQ
jgi:hypothetical protein